MRKIATLFALLCLYVASVGQNSYTVTAIPFNPDPFASGTPSGVNIDDVFGSVITLPFSFCFYDQSYDKLVIGSNGVITFDTANALQYCPWPIGNPVPNPSSPNLSIMAPFQDIDPGVGGSINYDVLGVAPYRRFVVSYYQIPMFSCNNMQFSEQVILYETTNIIETHILDKPLCATWNGGAAVHGIQVDTLTGFVVPGRNFPTQWTVSNDGYRFTPVGTCAGPPPADSVNGKVYADYNNNCIQDPGEFPRQNQPILANGGQFYDWTGADGKYGIGMAPGAYVISHAVTSPFYASACVPGGVYNVVLAGNVVNNQDFADSASVICSDLQVGIGSSGLRRCRQSIISVSYCNNGTYPDTNVVVTVTLNDSIAIDSASQAYTSLGGNMYSFNVGNLGLGQCGYIQLLCDIGCDSAGTIYCVSADIAGTYGTECDTLNNTDQDCQALLAPLDPNIKLVAAQNFAGEGYVTEDDIDADDELTYMIHFQNVGTSMAVDVVVRDTVSGLLDPSTIVPIAGSAPFNYFVNGNEVLFRFTNIMLPDSATDEVGSHGFVKFSVRQQPGHLPGTVIPNNAAIFFDFEAPVITNRTLNTIPVLEGVSPTQRDVVQLFPNPGHDQLTVQRHVEEEMEFVLMDIAGKEMMRQPLAGARTILNTAALAPGIYLYRLEANGQLLEAGKWLKH